MGEVHKLPRRRASAAPQGKAEPESKPAPCPICGRPAMPERRPFCSARCAQIDLGRWLGEAYRVPTEEAPEAGEAPRADDERR